LVPFCRGEGAGDDFAYQSNMPRLSRELANEAGTTLHTLHKHPTEP
jgi:hypothetical protein